MGKIVSIIFCISLCFLVSFSSIGCKNDKEKNDDERIAEAISIIKNEWNDFYDYHEIKDKHLEITNTKLINIKQNNDAFFSDVNYIVEFSLQTNLYDSAPYYSDVGFRNSMVVVYKDGRKEILGTNPFNRHINSNGPTDFSDIIDSIENFYGEYDQVINLH